MTHGIADDKLSGLTQDELHEALDYYPEAGVFVWKKGKWRKARLVGEIAGTFSKGYLEICLGNRQYKAHRLAWFYVYGRWPQNDLDHINRDKLDNRIDNLREATRAQNHANSLPSKVNKSGRKGVSWHKECRKWTVHIRENKASKYLGVFDDFDTACKVREAAEERVFGEFARIS